MSPNTLKNGSLSSVLKALMCESIKLCISGGGLLVAVVFGGPCASGHRSCQRKRGGGDCRAFETDFDMNFPVFAV